ASIRTTHNHQVTNMSNIRTAEEMYAEAASRGCTVEFPDDHELFIDIDSEEDLRLFERRLPIFEAQHLVRRVRKTPSPSLARGHFHIRVTLVETVPDHRTRIVWQAILGSDPHRELLALKHLDADHPPTVFFEKIVPTEIVERPDE